jgi:membrane-associated phospholipid phosphatase
MPSLHVAWAVWAAVAVWPLLRRRWSKSALIVYPALMVLAVIVTANHWVLDAVAGAALVWVSHLLARAVEGGAARVGSPRERALGT